MGGGGGRRSVYKCLMADVASVVYIVDTIFINNTYIRVVSRDMSVWGKGWKRREFVP